MLEWLFGKKKQQPQKKKKNQSEDKWMYQFMIQYLSSPIWRVRILDFVDNKCIVFDNQEENKFEYTTIHNEFKQLVGQLVDGMMEEIGMSEQKLAQIIQRGFQSKQHRKLFNQLLLADDFLRFKTLMLKRNQALEQEALQALQSGNLQTSESHKMSKLDKERQLIKQSERQENERKRLLQQKQEEQLRRALQMSRLESEQNNALKELQKKVQEHESHQVQDKKQQQLVKKQSPKKQSRRRSKQQKLQPVSNLSSKSPLGQLPPLKAPLTKIKTEDEQQFKPASKSPQVIKQIPVSEPIKQQKQQQQVSVTNTTEHQPVQEKPKQQTLEERKQRLMAQREKIRKQKQQHRKKQLDQQLNSQKEKTSQPVHTIVLQEDGFYDSKEPEQNSNVNNASVPEDELKRRKQLMNKIKNRIIDDF